MHVLSKLCKAKCTQEVLRAGLSMARLAARLRIQPAWHARATDEVRSPPVLIILPSALVTLLSVKQVDDSAIHSFQTFLQDSLQNCRK